MNENEEYVQNRREAARTLLCDHEELLGQLMATCWRIFGSVIEDYHRRPIHGYIVQADMFHSIGGPSTLVPSVRRQHDDLLDVNLSMLLDFGKAYKDSCEFPITSQIFHHGSGSTL
jgi:hypothetical protein